MSEPNPNAACARGLEPHRWREEYYGDRCSACGDFYPDGHGRPPDRVVFTHCNVCGVRLRTRDEHRMGMCLRCAAE